MYFSGFCLKNENELFDEYLIKNDFTISGFSYGAIKAFEYALVTQKRVDKLQLLSPAFFNDKDTKYKRMQLIFFKKDNKTYCENFLNNCGLNKLQSEKYFQMGSFEQLNELLYYIWDKDKLETLLKKGIKIEVFLGVDDKIINSNEAKEFFRNFGDVYYIKNMVHILK